MKLRDATLLAAQCKKEGGEGGAWVQLKRKDMTAMEELSMVTCHCTLWGEGGEGGEERMERTERPGEMWRRWDMAAAARGMRELGVRVEEDDREMERGGAVVVLLLLLGLLLLLILQLESSIARPAKPSKICMPLNFAS